MPRRGHVRRVVHDDVVAVVVVAVVVDTDDRRSDSHKSKLPGRR